MSNNRYRILVVEDEASIRSFMDTVLTAKDYRSLSAAGLGEAKLMFSSHRPDLVILDLGLPDGDGMDLIREIRKDSATPIVVLSARTDESDKVAALDAGANDYITKPFGTAELLARIRAALRNSRHADEMGSLPGGKFVLDDLVIDYDARLVTQKGAEVNLTQTEYNILTCLAEKPGKVMTYAMIIRAVWGISDSGSLKRLQVNIAHIRRKLNCRPGDNRYFKTELGVGYRMQIPE